MTRDQAIQLFIDGHLCEKDINKIFDNFEAIDEELTYELQLNRDLAVELSQAKRDVEYWKLSFNKQVEASRR